MATALVRDIDDDVYERLKIRASENNRSLEAELRDILTRASHQVSMARARDRAAAIRERLADRQFSDSGEILAEERQR